MGQQDLRDMIGRLVQFIVSQTTVAAHNGDAVTISSNLLFEHRGKRSSVVIKARKFSFSIYSSHSDPPQPSRSSIGSHQRDRSRGVVGLRVSSITLVCDITPSA